MIGAGATLAVDYSPAIGILIGHANKDGQCWRFSQTCAGWYHVASAHCPDPSKHA